MQSDENKQPCLKRLLKNFLLRRIPISSWMPSYTTEDIFGDVIAGVTIALTIIPQSIAYAALAGVDPQYGLNSAFMGSFIYVFFGTIREVVVGPTSLMALLTLQYTSHLNIDFVLLLCFLCGIVEMLMGLLNLGFLVSFISAPVVSGFTSATALIVALSQLKGLLGLKFKGKSMFVTLKKIFLNIRSVRPGDATLGIVCMVVILMLRKLKELKISNKIMGHRFINGLIWFVTTGRNAVAVLVTSLVTLLYNNIGKKPPFITTKPIESGIPTLQTPPMRTKIGNQTYELMDMVVELGMGPIIIPIVAVLANVAIAKVYATRTIDATQEMVALSLCNMAGSFFQSIPSCGAFSRSAVISASDVRTPLAGLYSAAIVLLALQFLSPFFYLIPRATLSAVLIAAIFSHPHLIDWAIIKLLWKAGAIMEMLLVLVTCIVCLLVRVEFGLMFGVLVSLGSLLYKWARPKITITKTQTALGDYVIVRPELSLYFPSVDYISTCVIEVGEQNRDLPILMDCKEIKGTDYSLAKGCEALSKIFIKRGQKFAFLDVHPECQKLWKSAGCKDELFWLSDHLTERLYGQATPSPMSGIHLKVNSDDQILITPNRRRIHRPSSSSLFPLYSY